MTVPELGLDAYSPELITPRKGDTAAPLTVPASTTVPVTELLTVSMTEIVPTGVFATNRTEPYGAYWFPLPLTPVVGPAPAAIVANTVLLAMSTTETSLLPTLEM